MYGSIGLGQQREKKKMLSKFLLEKLKEQNRLEEPDTNGKILKWI
jgi:hypothetical protein